MNGVLTLRRVGLRAQVRQRSFVAEGAEAVADTLRDVHSTAVHLIEAYPLPLPEGRRAGAEVHDDIEHGAADAGHVLRLARRHIREVDAAHHATGGHGRSEEHTSELQSP